ncbi:unnamed protein product [Miscanthus lutarioriparius]|uniref:Uncharacterized protein n=1 Tax=Miscanthus lutarioriparius TaxID=422564 RepID=A0A811MA80_9POAL|nr:unnamed protein product [Miscanthus lutarioriparius]
MCRATSIEGGFLRPSPSPSPSPCLDIRAFYLRLSSCSPAAPAPTELTLVYNPAIGGAALGLNGRALPPAAPAEVTLRRVSSGDAYAYASADRVAAAEGARFEVLAGEEVAAEGVFLRRRGGEGWRVECRRAPVSASASVCVAEVVVLAEGGVLMRDKARAAGRGRMRCGATRLEGIPEEATDLGSWGRCECRACGDDGDDGWEVVGDASDDGEPWKHEEEEEEEETVRWAMEMGVWAVCLGVGLLATARRFRRKHAFW